MARALAPILLLLLAGACGDDGGGAADGGEDAAAATCEGVRSLDPGDPEGHPEPLGAGEGEARAGRLDAAELPPDPAGLGTVAPGDFVLANDRVAAIIEDVGGSDIYDPWGGKIVGLALVRDHALVQPADFEEALVGLGRYTLNTTSVTVLQDGSAGGEALVRAVGTLAPLPVIDELTRVLIPGDYDGLPAALDYRLAPGSERIDIDLTVRWNEARRLRIPVVLHAFIQANRMPVWAPRVGFDIGTDPVPFIAFVNDGGAGYAWWSADGDLAPLFTDTGFSGLGAAPIVLDPCSAVTRPMASLVVGGPGLDGLLEARARDEGAPLREITGTVQEAGGAPAAAARVHATLPDGSYLTRSTTDAAGAYTLHVPEEVPEVALSAYRRGAGLTAPQRVTAPGTPAPLVLAPTGAIHVLATEIPADTPLPVRVQVIPQEAPPPVPPSFGELGLGRGRLHIAFPIDGDVTLSVPVGAHRVVVSHGYEYEMLDRVVTVGAGATEEVDARLERVVDTTGVMCGDFHIHTHRSLDSSDEVHMKVASAVGDGVEVLVRSEHEWVADFEPIIAELGVGAWAFGISSEELSTTIWGHFGVFPLQAAPSLPNAGAIEWAYMSPPEVFAALRSRPEDPALIINHPRSSNGFGTGKAYFTTVGYDPMTGMVARPEMWDDSFTLVEVFNGSDFERNRDTTVVDWFSFLSQGRRVFAIGSSDSHRVNSNPVGYPRTCLRFGSDDPRSLTADVVRDVLRSGAVTVSGGIYVDALVGGVTGPGGEARGVGARAALDVTVQAASWVDVDSLEVIVDGVTVETIPIDASTMDPGRSSIRFHGEVDVDVSSGPLGSYVVLVAAGDTPLDPVHPGRQPFGVTNPIFLFR